MSFKILCYQSEIGPNLFLKYILANLYQMTTALGKYVFIALIHNVFLRVHGLYKVHMQCYSFSTINFSEFIVADYEHTIDNFRDACAVHIYCGLQVRKAM